MAHAENEVFIKRNTRDVYDFLANGLNNPLWRPGVTQVRLASGPASGVGAVYSQRMAGPGGRSIDGDYQINVAEPGVRLGFDVVAGPARPTGSFALSGHDAGTTVSFSLTLEPKGLMKLMGPMVTKAMQAEVAQLENLKRVLEQDS
ncbi:SRPBCC family protein [Arthrobacter sp. STN4]|uniref:SRPBCC family protein n=1 Tax=Arthrobacter sp. STN4 TaxID=2923276 RepID=UPI00211A1FAB|nr:SRPBCC family protein [Arthrobacter sp. STN4]MCQ9165165.1 SRPBCC family protein [Arthrobacter sp. STN4]